MVDRYERFIASYLRLNAYFTITNFILHDPERRSNEVIGNYTEIDILGLRMPYSAEQAGLLHIANDPSLLAGGDGKTDVVIAEVKSGKSNKPNTIWRKGVSNFAIEYIVRFIGLHDESGISDVVDALASTFHFEDDRHRLRYIVFVHEPNKDYASRGVTYIRFRDIIEFLVAVRGESWISSNLGVASSHPQWDDVLGQTFSIANNHGLPVGERIRRIDTWLRTEALPAEH